MHVGGGGATPFRGEGHRRVSEVSYKGKHLQATLSRAADLVAQVENLRKQLDLLKVQSANMEKCVVGVEERTGRTEEKAALQDQGAKAL